MPFIDPTFLFGVEIGLLIHHSWALALPWLFLSDLVSCLLCPLVFNPVGLSQAQKRRYSPGVQVLSF